MKNQSIGFIGGGRIARIILGGWQHAGCMPAEVVVCEPSAEALEKLKAQFSAVRSASDAPWQLGQMDVVFAAVHPPALLEALKQLAGLLRPDTVFVSLAPKISISKLGATLGGFTRIARTIPNAPSLVGAGFNPVSFGPGLDPEGQERMLALLRPLGACPVVPEEHLEAYAVLTAMGPTYLWFQFQQVQELGRAFGLSQPELDAGLAAMVMGAAKTYFASALAPADVMDLVPVKPLHDDEEAIRSAYRTRLTGIYQKLKG